MSANFYKNSAKMYGVDFHPFHTLPTSAKEILKGHRIEDWPYFVSEKHSFDGGDEEMRTHKLTAQGEQMIRDGFAIRGFMHLPFPMAPHPYEAIVGAKIAQDSQSAPLLTAATVTSEGNPLAVCAVGPLGFNLNCQEAGMKMTGIVFCLCSVKTAPTQKDLIFKLFDEFFKKMLVKWIVSIFELVVNMSKLPRPAKAILVWMFKHLVDTVLTLAEWLLSLAWSLAEWSEQPSLLPKPSVELPEPPEEPKLEDMPENWREQRDQRDEQQKKEQDEKDRKRWEEKRRDRDKPGWPF